jgi:hypothetical protein
MVMEHSAGTTSADNLSVPHDVNICDTQEGMVPYALYNVNATGHVVTRRTQFGNDKAALLAAMSNCP